MRPDHALVTGAARTPQRLAAHALVSAALGLEAAAIAVLVLRGTGAISTLDGNTVGGYVLGATYPLVGWLIASRRPGNSIGWIFLAIGLSQALDTFAGQYAMLGLAAPSALPGADVMAWVGVWAWVPGFTLLVTLSILLFPDGRPPSPRWRPVIWLTGVAMGLLALPIAVVAWPLRGAGLLATGPVQSTDPLVIAMLDLQAAGLALMSGLALISLASLVWRYRRSRGVERAQLKWFVAAGVIEIIGLIASVFANLPAVLPNIILTLVLSPLLPIAAGVAILRFHLYDIDRIVSRSVAWAAISLLLVVVFGGAVVGLDDLLAGVTQGPTLAIAASTLAAFALFQPLRRRIQATVDRRFDRARYDAQRIVDAFAESLREQVDLSQINDGMLATVATTLRPRGESVWLRGRG